MNQRGFAPLLFIGIIIVASIGIIGASLLVKQMLVKQSEPIISPSPIASYSPVSQTIASSAAIEKSTKVLQLTGLGLAVKCQIEGEQELLKSDSDFQESANAIEQCIKTLPAKGKVCADLCQIQLVGSKAECISLLEKLTAEQMTREIITQERLCNQKAIQSTDECLLECEGYVNKCPNSLSTSPALTRLNSLIVQYCLK